MAADTQKHSTKDPIITLKPTQGLIDYFCPFCTQKLFRGNVKQFNLVCGNCNKLIKSEDSKETD
ncbi:MAG: hypothetical protein L3J69_12855 [Desulfobacula sp.]|nr:hypothetical protein [Desulfobacula sp.]